MQAYLVAFKPIREQITDCLTTFELSLWMALLDHFMHHSAQKINNSVSVSDYLIINKCSAGPEQNKENPHEHLGRQMFI